jgi:hypothetical protein
MIASILCNLRWEHFKILHYDLRVKYLNVRCVYIEVPHLVYTLFTHDTRVYMRNFEAFLTFYTCKQSDKIL